MRQGRRVGIAAGLALVLLIAFSAVASPPPLPSSFYGTIAASGFEIPAGTKVSAWIGGVKFAEIPVFTADGAPAFSLDVPGDIPETAAVEGGREGEAVVFRIGGAAAPQSAAWHTGTYERRDLTVAAGADIAVTVDDEVTSIIPGGQLVYTLTVRNLGTQTAHGVVLTDTLPSTVTPDSLDGGSLQGGVITWPAFDLAPGASTTRTLFVLVNLTLPVGTEEITNAAAVSHDGSAGIDPNPANDVDEDSDELRTPPDFAIAESDLVVTPANPQPGATVNVSLTVHNSGFREATGLVAIYNGVPYTGPVVGSRTVTLAAGASRTESFSFFAGASTVVVSAAVDPANEVQEINEGNNTARKFLAAVADLAVGIDNFLLAPAAPRAADAVAVNVTVRNAGRLAASNVPVEVFDGVPGFGGVPLFSGTIPAIPAGGNQAVAFSWTATEGLHDLIVIVDRADAILEMSEDNNQAQRTLQVPRAAGPDLTVSAMDVSGLTQSPLTLVAGGTVRATLANVGDAAAGPFAARLFEDRDGDGRFSAGDRELARQALPAGLAAGGATVATFSLQGSLEFFHPVLWAEADADGEIAELKEDNNLAACFGGCEPAAPPVPGVAPTVEEWWLKDVEIETAPMVVQLTDDNGDGRIDSRDVPEVVFQAEDATGAAVMARSGIDGTEVWTFRSTTADPLASRLTHVTAADLDGDGVAEVIAAERNGRLLAIDHHGQKLWVSDPIEGPTYRWQAGPAVGDLNGDGVPEIVAGRTVLSNTGKLIAKGAADRGRNYNYYAGFGWPLHGRADDQAFSIIADVDLDGRNEIVAGGTLYRLEGNQLVTVWERELPDHLMPDGFTAVANLDADPQAEIVYVSSGLVMVLNHDGSIASNFSFVIPPSPLVQPNPWSGPPTIADLDGDGKPEILIAGATRLVALGRWSADVFDVDAQTAATVFDLNGDGKPEVLYNDQETFYILNGQTGAVLYSRHNTSKTAQEYPVVADVDNDGQAEILLVSDTSFSGADSSTRGLHVLGNPGWRGTRPIWNQYSYHVTNVQLDGTVPARETPSWQAGNNYRVNEAQPAIVHKRPNATIGLPRVAAPASTGAPVRLRVGNGGRGVLPAGLEVVLYAGDPSANVVAATAKTSVALQPGAWQDVMVSWQQPGPAGAAATAVVDPQAQVEECDETDNAVSFTITETVLPDLAIPAGGVTVQASPVAGQKVTVNVRVDNVGSAQAPASLVRLYDGPPALGVRVGEAALPAVGPGATLTVPVPWETLGAAGTHTLYAVADGDDAVVELDEANNTGSGAASLAAATKPDPAAERLVIDPAEATVGTPVRLAVDVANRGSALAGGFVVAFRVNNAEVTRITSAEPLATGAVRTIEYTLPTLSLSGIQQIEARVDPSNAIAEQNENDNSQSGTLHLTSAGATVTVTTERVSYTSNDTATLTVKVTNSTAAAKTLGVKVTIQNAAGAAIATVFDQPGSFAPGTTTTNYTWGTGATPAGAYAAVAEVADGATVVARGSSPFSILGDRSAAAQIFADRDQYEPTQSAALAGRVRNTGVNQSLTNLQAKILVTAPAGAAMFTSTQGIALLSPGAEASMDAVWPVNNAAPGVYTARIEVRDNNGAGALLAFASAPLTVLDSSQTGAGLSGELTVSPETLGSGGLLLARFSTRNGGNADMSALRLRLRLERIADGVTAAAEEIPWPLARNAQRDGSLGLATDGFQEGEYVAVLEGLLPGGDLTLGRAPFSVLRGVSVADAAVMEGDTGTRQIVFAVTLSSAAPDAVSVDFATADGTAVAGEDYEAAGGTVTFQPGETRKTVAVTVIGDTAPESDEVFLLTLSNPLGAALGDGQALGTLTDEEGCPSPDLLADGGAEEGAADSDLPGWTAAAGAWQRRFADPVPLDGSASLGAAGALAELRQDVDLSPYAARIDAGGQELLFEGFVQSLADASPDGARVIVEYRDVANAAVLATFDSGEIASAGAWQAVVDARPAPAGARWARVRLQGVDHGTAGLGVFFDRLGLRSLGVPALTVAGTEVNEGNSGTVAARFELRLSCPAVSAVAVDYATANGTAVSGSDYDAASGTVTFAPGETAKTVDVAVHGDTVDEADESFFLDLASGTDAVVLAPRAAATISDDDGPVTASAGDAYADEGHSGTAQAVFTVSLSGPSGKTVKVSYATVAGTAAAGTDFTAASGTLTFAPGVESLTVAVPVKGDRLDEEDETFTLHLSAPVNAAIGDADGVGTILDDDQAELGIGDAAVLEGNGTAVVNLVFPVTLSLAADRAVQVHYATVDGTAVAGTDYQAAAGTLTLAPGATAASVSVRVLTNSTEQPDRTLLVRLDAPQVATLSDPEAVGTIRDDDGIIINLSNDVSVTEGDSGTANASFTVSVTNNNQKTVTVNYSTLAGTAASPADFTAVTGTLTFPPGTSLRTFTVPVVGDLVEEPMAETFQVALSGANTGTLQRSAATVTVLDNDGWVLNGFDARFDTVPGCLFLIRSFNSRGSAWKKQPIDLTRSFDQTYEVYLGANDGGADGTTFTLQTVGLNALGEAGGFLGLRGLTPAVSVEMDNFQNGWDPSFDHMAVDLQGNITHPGFSGFVPPAGTVPIPITASSANVEDGQRHTLRVIWNGTAKVLDVHFDGDERLMYGADLVSQIFGGNANAYFGFTAGSGSVTNDQYVCPTVQCADPSRPTQVSVGDVRVMEGNAGTVSMVFPVTLSCPSAQPVTVSFTTLDGTAAAGSDYTATAGTLTFQPGETSQDVVVPVQGDAAVEVDETLSLVLSDPQGAAARYAQGTGTIVTDDATVSLAYPRMVEGNAKIKFLVDFTLNAPLSVPASFNWSTADGTAVAGGDYTAASGTITFQPGETRKPMTLELLGDTAVEGDETFSIALANVVNLIAPPSLTVTLLDDDDCPTPNLVINGSGEELVNGELPGWVEVQGTLWTQGHATCCLLFPPIFDGSWLIYPGTPTIPAELRQDVDVASYARPIDDGLQPFAFSLVVQSWPETPPDTTRVVLEYRDAANSQVLGAFDSGTLTSTTGWLRLSDLRNAPAGTRFIRIRLLGERKFFGDSFTDAYFDAVSLVALRLPGLRIDDPQPTPEGNSGTKLLDFTVTATCASPQTMSVNYLTADGTAVSGTDYQPAFGTLTFAPGVTTGKVSVPIVGDAFTEGNETFTVKLASPVNAGIVRAQATGTILEDESTVSIGNFSVTEGNSGQVPMTFPVTLSQASTLPVAVDWTTVNGTATAGSDFVAASGTVQFDAGQTSKSITVMAIGDTVVEPDETFTVHLSNPSLVTLGTADGVGTIVQDDLSISIGNASVLEGNTGTVAAVFQVTLSQASSKVVTVGYKTEDRTATAGLDYNAVNSSLSFQPGETLKTITVQVKGDTLAETGELFTVVLSNPVNASILNGEGVGAIADDDDCPSPILLQNPGAEDALVNNEIPGWTEVAGTAWTRNGNRFEGSVGFFAGAVADGELRQDVDVSVYADPVDRGIQRFSFSGWVFVAGKASPDVGRVFVEYWDAGKQNKLGQYDSGNVTTPGLWQQAAAFEAVPVGTRWLRVRLVAHRTAASGNLDVFFDGFDLRSVTTPVLTIPDRSVTEGNAGTSTATFPVTLSCAQPAPVTVEYVSSEAGAEAGLDYTPVSGTLTFAPGTTVLNVPVTIFGDTRTEYDEQFVIELRSSSGPLLLIPRGTGTILDDDRPAAVSLTGTLRDMKMSHPDFEDELGQDLGIVQYLLGPDKKPVYANKLPRVTTHGQEAFDQWYRDVPGVNLAIPYTINLTPTADPRVYRFSNLAFWPIDNQLFGNEGLSHNFHMTYEIHTRFLYGGKEVFSFFGDDDIWVFVNGKLALDHGCVCLPYTDSIDLDAKAAELGLVKGGVYDMDIFWAERHTTGSSFQMDTTLLFGATDPGVLQLGAPTYEVTENGTFATISVLRTRGDSSEVSVTYATADGTATAGSDYTATTGTLTFRDGERGPKTFTIPIADDSTVEPAETVNLVLSNPTGGAELGQATAVLTIQDDDLITRPELAATKTAALAADNDGDGSPSPGDVLRYEIRVENHGNGPATDVALDDAVPAHTAVVPQSVTTSQGTVESASPVKVSLGGLAAGAAATVRFDAAIDSPVPAGVVEVRNQGMVSSHELPVVPTDDPALGGAADVTVTAITAAPKIVAEKTAALAVDADNDGAPSPGDTLEYTVTVRNQGNTSATSVAVDDAVPANTALVAGSAAASQGTMGGTASAVQAALGEIAGGGNATVRFRVQVASPVPAGVRQVSNQATVTSAELPAVPSDDPAVGGAADPTVTHLAAAPLLAVEKKATLAEDADGDGAVSPGDLLLYRITIANRGNTPATGVTLRDAIPENTAYEPGSLQVSQGTITTEEPVEAALGEIAVDATATATFRVRIDAAFPAAETAVANQATVTSPDLNAAVPSDDPDTAAPADATRTPVLRQPDITVGDAQATEGNSGTADAVFTVHLSAPSGREVRVDYATAAGSATAGTDFTAATGTLIFAPGEVSKSVAVKVIGDLILEADETFTVTLANAVGAAIADGSATGIIVDDEACPSPNLLANPGAELSSGVGTIPGWTVVEGAQWQTRGGTNPAPAEGAAYFYAGQTAAAELKQDVAVAAYAERIAAGGQVFAFEGRVRTFDEQPSDVARVIVEYRDAANAVVLGAFDTGEIASPLEWRPIADTRPAPAGTRWIRVRLLASRFTGLGNDGYFDALALRSLRTPVLTVDDVAVDEGDSGTTDAPFPVRLSCPVQGDVSVGIRTADGTALAGQDYTALAPATLAFPAGTVTKTVAVPVIGDTVTEPDETFKLLLSDAQGAVLLDPQATGTIRESASCPEASTIDYKGYTAASCAVPQNAVTVHDQTELNAYLANFGFDGTKVRNVIVNFNPAGEVKIVSPCEIRLKGTGTAGFLDINAEKVCLYGRKGVTVAEDHGNPDQGIVARAIKLVSEEGSAGFSKGLALTADTIDVRALKEAKVGLDCDVDVAGALNVVSTGDLSTSEALVRQDSTVNAGSILVEASRGATIGPSTVIDTPGNLVVRSTGTAVGSIAKVSQSAHVTAGTMDLTSGNKVTVEQLVTIDVTGHLTINAAGTCSVSASAAIHAGSTSGSCLP